MNKQQCITILGSTGSIGTSTLDVLSRHPAQYRIHALTASSQVELMLSQCARFKPEVAVMVQELAGRQLAERVKAEGLPVQVRWGAAALDEVASAPQVDAVMAAIVGAAGLSPASLLRVRASA
jgi:1-deoxy-D-xylulose-5-phosphate reductoisomerase